MRVSAKGLRARSATAFAGLALFLSTVLSLSTYQFSRAYLLNQREALGLRQATLDATVARGLLSSNDPDRRKAVTSSNPTSGSRAVLRYGGDWYAAVVELNEEKIPIGIIRLAEDGVASRQRIDVNGTPYLVVGIPLPDTDASYFEFIPLTEYQQTISTLLQVLVLGASMTTIAGAVAGWNVSRRVLRPLKRVAAAAQSVSDGNLTSRLDASHDPDLRPVADAFNEMATSLQHRIERDMRFTADVSHELRTPLTALGSAVSLAQRSTTPERSEFALQMVAQQVDQLRRLTLELLEISRFDAGVAELHAAPLDVAATTVRIVEEFGLSARIVDVDIGESTIHVVDELRYERVVANLIENAARYGGGAVAVALRRTDGELTIVVDDAGPGVRADERLTIFGRFHRGSIERSPDAPKGTGLGLSLVHEYVTLHGGSVVVSDRPDGGARFTVTLP